MKVQNPAYRPRHKIKMKIIDFLNQKYNDLNAIAYLIGFTAIISAVLGLIRNRALAYFIGAGDILDIYFAAFKIPDFIFLFSTSFISVFAILPFISDKEKESKQELKKFINACFTVFIILIIFFSSILFVLLPQITDKLFSFEGESLKTLISFSRLFLLQVILLSTSTFLLSITQAKHRFVSYALAPVAYNFGILIGVFGYNFFGPYSLVFGVIFGALIHLLLQFPPILKERLMPMISAGKIIMVVKHSFPRSLSISLESLSIVFTLSHYSRNQYTCDSSCCSFLFPSISNYQSYYRVRGHLGLKI